MKHAAIAALSEVAYRVHRPSHRPVLLYHEIHPLPDPSDPWCVSTRAFAEQMRLLHDSGFTAVSCDALPDRHARRPLFLAFDDGFVATALEATPVLVDLGFSATFFIVPSAMGGTSEWERTVGAEPAPLMTWEDARHLLALGMDIGSHSYTHADLSRADDRTVHYEVHKAARAIATELGSPPLGFSVPFGRDDPRIDAALAREGHRYKITNSEAVARDGGYLVRPSIPVLQGDTAREVLKKAMGAYTWFHTFRRWRKTLRGIARRPG